MPDRNEVHYDAFISYRHNEFDSFVAQNLHKKLESFKLPKSVIPKVKKGKTRIERVFRDVDELPLTDNLSDPISKALLNSDYLITICTPRYPESRWCMKEIEVFLQSHPRDHILVVLAEDEPVNSFPEILNYEDVKTVNEKGETVITRRELEPLAADTRGSNKKEVLKAMDTAVIKLCAAMFGLNYDDLKQRHREQRIRKLATIFGGIGAAVLAFAIFATVMLIKISVQNATITEQNSRLQDDLATSMALISGNMMSDGRVKDAVYAVRGVLPDDGEGFNANALKALYSDMGVYKVSDAYAPICTYDAETWVGAFDVSTDGKNVLANQENAAFVYDADTGEVLHEIRAPYTNGMGACLLQDGVIWSTHMGCNFYSFETKESTPLDDIDIDYVDFVPINEGTLALAESENGFYAIDSTGNTVFSMDISSVLQGEYYGLYEVTSFEGKTICYCSCSGNGGYFVLDPETGEVQSSYVVNYDTSIVPVIGYDGKSFFSAVLKETESGIATDVVSVDADGKTERWRLVLDSFDPDTGAFYMGEESLYLCGNSEVAVIDPYSGILKGRYSNDEEIIKGWIIDDTLHFISSEGKVFYCEGESGKVECTHLFYTTPPDQYVSEAMYVDGNLYCRFNSAAYVTRYSERLSKLATEYSGEYTKTQVEQLWPDQVFGDEELYDFSTELVDTTAFYSDDGKYSFGFFTDHTAKIFDSATGELVISFETTDSNYDDFRYSPLTGSYILSGEKSIIFDKDMRIICECDRIACEDGGDFILESSLGSFKVAYIDYDSLIKMADEYLGDYEPSNTVKLKYGLN